MTNAYVALQKRLTSFISSPVEDQYTSFTRMYPNIVQRVPSLAAGAVGMSTLSAFREFTSNLQQSETYLGQLQVKLSYHEYQMGHQINEAVLKDLNNWLVE